MAQDEEAELAPVFAELEELDREAARLHARAEAAAERVRRETAAEAERIVAEGRLRADVERDEALRAGLEAADAECAAVLAGAEVDAERIGELGDVRLPRLVTKVLERVLEPPG